MITFQQHLRESLRQGYTFDVDNIDGDGSTTEYRLSFNGKNSRYFVLVTAKLSQKTIRIDFSDDDGDSAISGIAGTDAIKVFATLGKILEQALISHPGFSIQFEGSNNEPSKVKLYRSLAKRAAERLKGNVKETSVNGSTRFTIHPR